MDPLTLTTTIGAVSKGVFTCVKSLYIFIEDAAGVDETVRSLYEEARNFQRMVDGIGSVLNRPIVRTHERLALWKDVNNYLNECHQTVGKLEITIRGLDKDPAKGNIFKDGLQQFKLDLKESEIKRLRDQMQSHGQMLGVTLQVINLHISGSGPQEVIEELNPQLKQLQGQLDDVYAAVLSIPTGDAYRDKQHRSLRESAQKVVSHATEVMGSRSTVYGSEFDLPQRFVRPRQQSTTGSELGEPLQADKRANISSWITRNAASTLEAVQEESSKASKIGSNESHNTENTFVSGTATLLPNDEFGSDEEELEIEMMQKYIERGRQKYQEKKYSQAESMLRKALSKSQALGTKAGVVDRGDLTLEIAQVCFQQDKLDLAQEVCENCLKESPVEDSDRARTLRASHLLAQIQLRRGALDEAKRRCKQTLTGRKRFEGKSQAYHETVALLVAICDAQEDEEDGMAYASLLPDDFQRPDFRMPTDAVLLNSPSNEKAQHKTSKSQSIGTEDTGKAVPLTAEALRSLSGKSDESVDPLDKHTPVPHYTRPMPPPEPSKSPREESLPRPHWNFEKKAQIQQPPTLPINSRQIDERLGLDRPPVTPFIPKSMSDDAVPSSQVHRSPTAAGMGKKRATARSASDSLLKRKTSLPTIPKLVPMPKSLSAFEQDEAVRILTVNGKEPLSRTFDPSATLLWAAEYGHDLPVRLLLQGWSQQIKKKTFGISSRDLIHRKGVYVDTTDVLRRTPLHLAATFGHESTCQILLERGSSTKARQACLIETCPNPDCKLGPTALESAVSRSHDAVVKVFLAKGADLSPNGKSEVTPLHSAVITGREEIVLLLLAAKMDPKAKDIRGYNSLHMAASQGHDNIIKLLIEYGVPPDTREKNGFSALEIAVMSGHQDCMETLIELGADVNHRDDEKLSLLHVAAVNNHEHLLPVLLEQDLDLDAREGRGGVPLHCSATTNGIEFSKKLIAAGADPFARDNNGYTALHYAAEFGHGSFIDMILDQGLSVDGQTTAGKTALMLSAELGQNSAADILLLRGADVNARDYEGHTAMWHAIEMKQKDVAWTLKYAGAEYCRCAKCEGVLAGYDSPLDPPADLTSPWSRGLPPLMPPMPGLASLPPALPGMPSPPPGIYDPYTEAMLAYQRGIAADPYDPYGDALLPRVRSPYDDPFAPPPPRFY